MTMEEAIMMYMQLSPEQQKIIDDIIDKKLEISLRRNLKKAGYLLRKSRKPISLDNHGGYMIIDASSNTVVCGSCYELTLDDVVDWTHDIGGTENA